MIAFESNVTQNALQLISNSPKLFRRHYHRTEKKKKKKEVTSVRRFFQQRQNKKNKERTEKTKCDIKRKKEIQQVM